MSEPDSVQVSVSMAKHLRDAAMRDLPHGQFSEEVRKLAQQLAFGEEVAEDEAMRAELENVRADIDEINARIENLQAERSDLKDKEKRLERNMDNQRKQQQKFEGNLEMLESLLLDGVNMDVGNSQVKQTADTGGMKPKHVVEKLKERNPNVPEYAFKDGLETEETWDGIGTDNPGLQSIGDGDE